MNGKTKALACSQVTGLKRKTKPSTPERTRAPATNESSNPMGSNRGRMPAKGRDDSDCTAHIRSRTKEEKKKLEPFRNL